MKNKQTLVGNLLMVLALAPAVGRDREEAREANGEETVEAALLSRPQDAHTDERPVCPEEAEGCQMITSLVVTETTPTRKAVLEAGGEGPGAWASSRHLCS